MGKVDYNTFIAILSELNNFIYKWDRDYVLEVKAIGVAVRKFDIPYGEDIFDVQFPKRAQ